MRLPRLTLLIWTLGPLCLAQEVHPRDLTLLFTGDVRGNYGPCGCDNNPTGGLSRRAGYATAFQERTGTHVLHVDSGNFFSARGAYARRVNDLMLEGIRRLPIRVVNLAPEDLYLWQELATADLPQTSVISSNLSPLEATAPHPRTFAIVNVPAQELSLSSDLKIGFIGISDPGRVKPNSKFRGKDPLESVGKALTELADQVDFVVVLADINREPGPLSQDSLLYQIASKYPEILVILSTESRYLLHPPEQVGNAIVLSSVERGRYLGQVRLILDSDGSVITYEPEFIELKEGVAEDAELLRMQERLDSQLLQTP